MLLSQLNYFRVVARYEHISRAAEELMVAQPALSATIGKLEKELGVPLFDRQGRNIELNDAGRRLLAHADFVFDQVEAMKQALVQTKEILENAFTLSVSNSIFLNGWLQQFVLANPKIHLCQKMLSESQMIEALQEETIDVALGEFDQEVPGIVRKTIVEDEYVIIIPKGHRLAEAQEICFDDIRDENIVALPSNTIFIIADRMFAQRDCKPNIVFEGNQRMMGKMMQSNHGLLFASRQMLYMLYRAYLAGDSGIAASRVMIQPIVDLECRYRLSLCWKEGRELPLMACKFIDAMEQSYPRYQQDALFRDAVEVFYPDASTIAVR